jgi:CxxC-x17-CxxC domain-containing protein
MRFCCVSSTMPGSAGRERPLDSLGLGWLRRRHSTGSEFGVDGGFHAPEWLEYARIESCFLYQRNNKLRDWSRERTAAFSFCAGHKFLNSRETLCANDILGCTISTRRPMAGDIQLQCSDCGQDFTFTAADQAFFQERGYSTPKRCKNCRMAKKNDQGGSGYRSAPAQGTPVICSGCGQPTTVPFEPRGDRPVFCRDCYQARKGSGGGGGSSRGRGR